MRTAIKPRHKKKKQNLDVVTLIDGRRIEFDFSGRTVVSNDSGNHAFDFSWIDPGSQCHRSALTVLRGLLLTHSVDYARQCTKELGALITEADDANGGPI